MNAFLNYRENEYFNNEDQFVFFNGAFNRLFTCKVYQDGAYWWTDSKPSYKATSLLSSKVN